MTMQSPMPVWHGTRLSILLFQVSLEAPYTVIGQSIPGKYTITDVPLLNYCYWQKCNIEAKKETRHIPVTDRPIKRIANDGFYYKCSVNGFFCRHVEINTIGVLDRAKKFQIIAIHYQPGRTEWQVVHSLRMCVFDSLELINTENGISNYDADIIAEEYENYVYY